MAVSRTGTVSCVTRATLTGIGGGPLPASLPGSLTRPSATTRYVPSPAAASTAMPIPTKARRRRPDWVMNRRFSARNALLGKQLLERLAAAHQPGRGAFDQHLGGARPRVVVRGHHHAIRARRHQRKKI